MYVILFYVNAPFFLLIFLMLYVYAPFFICFLKRFFFSFLLLICSIFHFFYFFTCTNGGKQPCPKGQHSLLICSIFHFFSIFLYTPVAGSSRVQKDSILRAAAYPATGKICFSIYIYIILCVCVCVCVCVEPSQCGPATRSLLPLY